MGDLIIAVAIAIVAVAAVAVLASWLRDCRIAEDHIKAARMRQRSAR